MLTLTKKSINTLPINASGGSRIAALLMEEDGGASPVVVLALVPGLASVFMVVGSFFERDLQLGIMGVVLFAACLGGLYALEAWANLYFEARQAAADAYLDARPREQVIEQALSLGPDYIGRETLFYYLSENDEHWGAPHVERLVALARSEEMTDWQRSTVRSYLDDHYPGWSISHPAPSRDAA